jgi:hypothetical protein
MPTLLNTLVFTLLVPASDTLVTHLPLESMIDRDVMAYHFRLEATDASGATITLPSRFTVTLRFGAEGRTNDVRVTGLDRDVVLPRPLGVRVDRAAGVEVRFSLEGLVADGVTLRLSIEHEPADRGGSRIPVLATRATFSTTRAGAQGWEWVAPTDGRLLNLTGLVLGHLNVVDVVDAETQEVLWSSDLRGSATDSPVGATLRLGVPVRAGRRYRVIARGVVMPAAADLAALVLPAARTSGAVASAR